MAESRYPALARLGRGRRRQVPVVLQSEWSDCGAACLAMALALHGNEVPLHEVRAELGGGRDGLDARLLLDAGQRFGLRGRGLELELDDLQLLPRGAILHWEFNHFVVFDRVVGDRVEIVDPSSGRQVLSLARVSQRFTGIALVFEPSERFEPRARRGSRLASYLHHIVAQRAHVTRVLVTSIFLRVLALALPLLTALIVDHVVPRSDAQLLLVVGLGLVGVVAFQVVSALIRAHLLLQLRTNLDTRLTLGFLEHLVDLPYDFFQRRSTGDLMMRVASNSNIRETLTSNTLSALLDGTLVVLYLALISAASWRLGLLTLGLGIAQVVVFLVSRRRIAELMREQLEAQARAQNYLVQVLGGIETLKVAGAESLAVERWSNLFVDQLNVELDNGRVQARIDATMTGLGAASPLLVLSYGAVLVIGGELSLGAMLALGALAAGFLTPLASLVSNALEVQRLGAYIERINDVFSTPIEQPDGDVGQAGSLTGRISLRNVSFRYSREAPLVVEDASLEIAPGDCVAVVGRSGSGKSTLASLMLGLYRPSEGGIYYDGTELGGLELRSVRRQLGYVPQDPYIFGQSVRENVAMAEPGISVAAVERACRRAAIHTDIMTMRMGYDTIIADGGGSLSGGQRQRLALARALVNEPAILVLDEATSALDTRTEAQVMAELERMSCVRIIIAHRLSTIRFADKIVVMDAGRIVDVGSHAELLERCELYQQLVAASGSGSSPTLRAMEASHG